MDNDPPTFDPAWQECLEFLTQTPDKISKFLEGLSDTELRRPESDGRFSALENICHLRDLESEGYGLRIDRMLDETNPLLPDFDGARAAAERNYNQQQSDVALAEFTSSRRLNIEKLRGLTSEEMQRAGTLEGVGDVTLKRLAEMMREHDESHLDDMRVLRQRLERQRSGQ